MHSSSKIVDGLSHPLRQISSQIKSNIDFIIILVDIRQVVLIFLFLCAFRINTSPPIATPRQHVTPSRRISKQHADDTSPKATNNATSGNATEISSIGRRNKSEYVNSLSLNDSKELKRQLDVEREKVKQLSAQLTTNVCLKESMVLIIHP